MNKFIFFILIIFLMKIVSSQEAINISSLSLDEKLAQMVIVRGDEFNERFLKLGVGGIFLDKQSTREQYINLISKYKNSSRIELFVSTDLEGYWNPFIFFNTKNFIQVKDKKEAYALGKEHSKILKELGFNLDFSPVVEVKNKVWPGRSFNGSSEEINEKIENYILGLQESGILATAKHYPGGNLIKNPHYFKVKAIISNEDLENFDVAMRNNISAIMIGHASVYGAVDSKGKQSTLSKEVISGLRNKFLGLILTDEINMWGLRQSYLFRSSKIYIDLINAGNDIILDFSSYDKVKKRIEATKKAVINGRISEEEINEHVKRILEKKGYKVLD